jgi:hypothetical protein
MTIANLPDLQSLARALGGVVVGNQALVPGPGHSARDRSLSIRLDAEAPDGFVVHSFCGDDPIKCKDYVRDRAGIEPFKPNGKGKSQFDIGKVIAAQSASKSRGNLVATFDYTDTDGALLYQVLKYDPKDFRQRCPDGKGGWSWKLDDVGRVVYRWPELLKFPDATTFVCEGEKDADRVASLGHCATTVACGKWTDECVKALAGRDIVILEDNDDAGREKAIKAANALHATAKTVRVVRLPDLPEKGDVSDWLDADPSRAGKLAEVCFETPVWTPATTASASPWHFHQDADPAPTTWLIKGILPETGAGLISGQWGTYKTTIALDMSVSVMTATPFAGVFLTRMLLFLLLRRSAASCEHDQSDQSEPSNRFKEKPFHGRAPAAASSSKRASDASSRRSR